jgi:hypothetical protein
VVLDDKWQVATKVTVELDGPVVVRFNSTFMADCGEAGWLIYQSDKWWWVRNGK